MAEIGPRRKRGPPDVRRRAIINEAIRAIGERGYFGFTIQDLAQKCGLTNGGLLYHFGSKEKLLLAVLEERERRDEVIVRSEPRPDAADGESGELSLAGATAVLHTVMVRSREQPEIVRLQIVLQAEALEPNHPAHGYFRDRETRLIEIFAELVCPFSDDPHGTSRLLIAIGDGLEQQWLRENRNFDLVGTWDRAVALLLRPVGGSTVVSRP